MLVSRNAPSGAGWGIGRLGRSLAVSAAFVLGALAVGTAPAAGQSPGPRTPGTHEATPESKPESGDLVAPGSILSDADIGRYQQIFALQDDGRWSEADRLIAALDDDVLVGHVLFQRYMHPTAWRSNFKELQGWLARYADHPGADTIHILAQRRGSGPLTRPNGTMLNGWGGPPATFESTVLRGSYANAAARATAQRVWNQGWQALRRGHTLSAKRIIEGDAAGRALSRRDHDRLRAGLAYAYFIHGRDDWALDWAGQAIGGSGTHVPLASWAAGLATWRSGDMEAAHKHFARLAASTEASPWMASAGAYWAARAALRARVPEQVSGFLHQAATHPRTFYGLLARRVLGMPLQADWERDTLTPAEARLLAASRNGRRALALVQIGDVARAEQELRKLYPGAEADLQAAVMRYADLSGMSSLALYLAAVRSRNAEEPGGNGLGAGFDPGFDNASYPVPTWEPEGGWTIDRALVYAFVRQESGFNPDARSHAGARGLMQVMPATAAYIAGDPALRGASARNQLLDPELNLALGQKYLEYLLDLPEVSDNLFFTAVAYNAGPGNLRRWQREVKHGDDPLLFIESIPSRETRLFVERILANLWMYRSRMGQDIPSLDMVAAGDWPRYLQQDNRELDVAFRR